MAEDFEIRIPRFATGLRIKHYKCLTDVGNVLDDSVVSRAAFIADFSGVSLVNIKLLTKKDVDRLYKNILRAFGGMKVGAEPAKEITVNGKAYELIDPKTVGVGWHIDLSTCDLQKDPVRLACLYYFPKGEVYGKTDENENLLHPISERYEEFKEHMMLQTFMEANAFFLGLRLKLMKNSTEREIIKVKTIKMLERIPMIGQRLSTLSQRNTA